MKALPFTVVRWASHGLVARKHFNFFAKSCLTFNITPSAETFTQRANAGTNITLLSIYDLPALHPPSQCSPTMEKCKGEGGRSHRHSLIHWCYTNSRIGDSIQTMKEWENPRPVFSTQGIWGSRFHLFQQIGWKLNIFMIAIVLGTFKFSFSFFAVSWKTQRPWATTNNMHGPVQNRSENGSAPEFVSGAPQNSPVLTKPGSCTDKQRRASITGKRLSAAHVSEQNMSWSFILSCCRVFFLLSSLTQLAQQLLVFALSQISTESGFKSRQYEKKVWNIYRYI